MLYNRTKVGPRYFKCMIYKKKTKCPGFTFSNRVRPVLRRYVLGPTWFIDVAPVFRILILKIICHTIEAPGPHILQSSEAQIFGHVIFIKIRPRYFKCMIWFPNYIIHLKYRGLTFSKHARPSKFKHMIINQIYHTFEVPVPYLISIRWGPGASEWMIAHKIYHTFEVPGRYVPIK